MATGLRTVIIRIQIIIGFLCFAAVHTGFAQSAETGKSTKDSAIHRYFIISAGEVINAYYNDKPLEVETIAQFNTFIQTNAKSLKDSWVVVTGKPKTGTFDDVLKTLSHYKFKHVTKNILPN